MTPPRRPEGPQRTCVGCRRIAAPSDLVRLVVGSEGVVAGKGRPGRGAWLCGDQACVDAALAKGALARALRIDRSALDADAVRRAVLGAPPGTPDPAGGGSPAV